jgi:hypothetical protein
MFYKSSIGKTPNVILVAKINAEIIREYFSSGKRAVRVVTIG